ncbi:MAG: hypothetical protein WC719_01225 [Patescibacteria group bacterium]
MRQFHQKMIAGLNLSRISAAVLIVFTGLNLGFYALASSTSEFTQAINPGTLSTDIVNGSYVSVSSPTFSMSAVPFSFSCQASTGTFGSATQQIYVKNPDASDTGWTLTLAGSSPTAYWDSITSSLDFDFNDSASSGCSDGADTDILKGQMTVDPSIATLAKGACAACDTANITKGNSTAFAEGATDSVTLLTAAAGSSDIGDWTLQGVSVSQTIPGEQPAANDYKVNLSLSIVAN